MQLPYLWIKVPKKNSVSRRFAVSPFRRFAVWPFLVLSLSCVFTDRAQAGEWQAVPPPLPDAGCSDTSECYQQKIQGYIGGTASASKFIYFNNSTQEPEQQYPPYTSSSTGKRVEYPFPTTLNGTPPADYLSLGQSWGLSVLRGQSLIDNSVQGVSEAQMKADKLWLRQKYEWVPAWNNPNEAPSSMFCVKVEAWMYAATRSGDNYERAGDTNRRPSAESISASVSLGDVGSSPAGGSPQTVTAVPGFQPSATDGNPYSTRASATWYALIYTDGKRSVWGPKVSFDGSAKVDNYIGYTKPNGFGGNTYYPNKGNALLTVSSTFSHFNMGVFISSDIEKSWKKGVGALPAKYQELKADGNPRYESVQVAGGNTPSDASDDVWKLECIRDTDGSLIVESAATWDDYEGNGRWYGGGQWRANTLGFTSPTYSWSFSGGFPTDRFQTKLDAGTEYVSSFAGHIPNPLGGFFGQGIELTADPTGSTLKNVSSAFTVTVTDSSPITLTNTYKVNWHPPAEWETNPKYEASYFEEVEPQELVVSENGAPSGDISAKWKWKTARAGEVPTPQDYTNDGWREALKGVNDVFGVGDAAPNEISSHIEHVKDVRLRLLLYSALTVGGKLYDENISANGDVIGSADFGVMWNYNTPSDNPADDPQWVDANGQATSKPVVPTDPAELNGSTPDQWLELEKSKWTLYNPRLLLGMKNRVFRGDGYDAHGYSGHIFNATTTHTGSRLYIGDFKRNSVTEPTPDPNGG